MQIHTRGQLWLVNPAQTACVDTRWLERFHCSSLKVSRVAVHPEIGTLKANRCVVYEHLHISWALSLFGFVMVALLPIPWMFYKFWAAASS